MSKILFLITEDWFFRSHFMPLARQALAEGREVLIAARVTGALLNEPGVRVIDMPFARGSLKPWELGRQIAALRAIIARERPDVVHAIALKAIALLLFSGVRDVGRVLAITGRGYLAVARTPWAGFMSGRLQSAIRSALRQPRTAATVENAADAAWASAGDGGRIVMMPGAGVDPARFQPAPELASPPIVVGVAARLIWSKGVDLAVAAVRTLRGEGAPIVLRVAGAPDPENPEHVSPAEIARWRSEDGVKLLGAVSDVAAFWAGAHIACLPSRGGEGLPRSLLEASACQRPIVTTNVPGCADFVVDGETGAVAPAGDASALAAALRTLAGDAGARARMGAAGRMRVAGGYTCEHAGAAAARAWRLVGDAS